MTKEDDVASSRDTEIGKRVAALLESPDSTPELEREILWRLLDTIKGVSHSQRRIVVAIVGVAAGFELLNRNLVREFSVTGVKITDLAFLRIVAPVAMAYLLFRFAVLARDVGVNLAIVAHLTCQRFYGLYITDMDRVLVALAGPAGGRPPPAYTPKWRGLGDIAVLFQIFMASAGTLLFIPYAFWQLHIRGGFEPLAWIALGVAAVCIVLAAGFIVMAWNIDKWSFSRELDFSSRLAAAVRSSRKSK